MRWRNSLVKIFSTLTSTVGITPAVEHRRRLVAHQHGDLDVGLGLHQPAAKRRIVGGHRPVAPRPMRQYQVVERAAQVAGVGQRAAFEIQRAGDVGPARG